MNIAERKELEELREYKRVIEEMEEKEHAFKKWEEDRASIWQEQVVQAHRAKYPNGGGLGD